MFGSMFGPEGWFTLFFQALFGWINETPVTLPDGGELQDVNDSIQASQNGFLQWLTALFSGNWEIAFSWFNPDKSGQ